MFSQIPYRHLCVYIYTRRHNLRIYSFLTPYSWRDIDDDDFLAKVALTFQK